MSSSAFNPAGSAGYFAVTSANAQVFEAVPNLLINLATHAPSSWWAALRSISDTTGGSVRITNAAGETAYSYHLEDFDINAETGWLRFNSQGLSTSVDTTYRIYCGNAGLTLPAVTDTLGRNNVWTASSCVACFTNQQDPGGSAPQVTDITGGGRNLSTVSMVSGDRVAGQIGKGYLFDGSTKCAEIQTTTPITTYPLRVSCWFKSADTSSTVRTMLTLFSGSGNGFRLYFHSNHNIRFNIASPGITSYYNVSPRNDGAWHLIEAVSRAANDHQLYIDGASVATSSTSSTFPTFDSSLTAMGEGATTRYFSGSFTNSEFFPGHIDEVRFHNADGSLNAHKTRYANEGSNGSFWSAGAWVSTGNRRRRILCGAAA